MKLSKVSTLFVIALSLQACNAMKGQSDMENMIRLMHKDNPADYEAVVRSFIENAKAGHVEKMIALTSQVTINKMGIDSLKSHYTKDTVPALKACTSISEGGDIIHIDKSQTGTGSGWVYKKTCTYDESKTVPIQFVILNENGRIALTSFGLG
ncbi:MAG: hypothetical protein ACI9IA_000557 [Enterobacterales bacterium]|jgi:hypothetical protein